VLWSKFRRPPAPGLGYVIAAHTAFCIPFAYLPIEGPPCIAERPAFLADARYGRL
jgi:hypothetical protein